MRTGSSPPAPRAEWGAAARRTAERVTLHAAYVRWVTPAQLRLIALREMWVYRACWRMPQALQRVGRERDREISEIAPVMIFFGLLVAAGVFVAMPFKLGERAVPILEQFWPIWVAQIAPMLVAQTMALLNTPSIALQLTELDAQGAFEPGTATAHDRHARSALICLHLIPIIAAHTVVGMVSMVLLVGFTLAIGIVSAFVLAIGDVGVVMDVVLRSVTPLDWLHAVFTAFLLSLAVNVSAAMYAWPGAFQIKRSRDMHRLGVRTMLVSCATCAVVWLAQTTLISLLQPPSTSAASNAATLIDQAKDQPGLVGGVDKGR